MEIKTRFAIGDSVWTIKDGRAYPMEVTAIIVTQDQNGLNDVHYRDSDYLSFPERTCFLSKEELIDYFLNEQ